MKDVLRFISAFKLYLMYKKAIKIVISKLVVFTVEIAPHID